MRALYQDYYLLKSLLSRLGSVAVLSHALRADIDGYRAYLRTAVQVWLQVEILALR